MMPDGSTQVAELKTGEALLRPPVTYADEALDNVGAVLVKIEQLVIYWENVRVRSPPLASLLK
jgi:hypothetical protein